MSSPGSGLETSKGLVAIKQDACGSLPEASLRSVPDSFSQAAVAAINARLEGICEKEAVSIPLAIESGSRAWGFPSPDSDYDARFIFVRRPEDYLTLWPCRDVIETPLTADLDVNGWDLSKALKLMLRGNAVVLEWLTSPIVYRGEAAFREELLSLASRVSRRTLVARHYLHLGERQRRMYLTEASEVAQKKIFYALRPAAALRWMRVHEQLSFPPMHFPSLLRASDPPSEVMNVVEALMARKAVTRELGTGRLSSTLAAFIEAEFAAARACFGQEPADVSDEARWEIDRFFRKAVGKYGPAS